MDWLFEAPIFIQGMHTDSTIYHARSSCIYSRARMWVKNYHRLLAPQDGQNFLNSLFFFLLEFSFHNGIIERAPAVRSPTAAIC